MIINIEELANIIDILYYISIIILIFICWFEIKLYQSIKNETKTKNERR